MSESKSNEFIVTNQGNDSASNSTGAKRGNTSPLHNEPKIADTEAMDEENIEGNHTDDQEEVPAEVITAIDTAVERIVQEQQARIYPIPNMKKDNKQLLKAMMEVMGPVMSGLGSAIVKGCATVPYLNVKRPKSVKSSPPKLSESKISSSSRRLKPPVEFRTRLSRTTTVLIELIADSVSRTSAFEVWATM